MDALSAALSSVRMTGAIFADLICTAPWGFAVPAIGTLERIVHQLAPGTERVIGYHLVTTGEASVRFAGSAEIALTAGDIVILRHGEAHEIKNGAPSQLLDSSPALARWLAGDVTAMEVRGGGEETRFVCGYFGCERHAARLFLAGLPSIMKVNVRDGAADPWLESAIRHLLGEARSRSPGGAALLSRMAEALFIETLRRYMQQLPPEQRGWLAGARDPVVGNVLALLHRAPSHPWTMAELAEKSGASRSLLAERFAQFLGEPPLTYLARWRLQLAARLLQTTQKPIVQVALEVGYESEAAFNRAFKREFALPPAKYRRTRGADGAATSTAGESVAHP